MIGCSNSVHKIDKWYTRLCEEHGVKFGSCICQPPFQLFPFPAGNKDPVGRRRWTKLVNRRTLSGSNWQPKAHDRICSEHFKNGEPTKEWPDPTEKLGYLVPVQSSSKSPRNPPKERSAYIPRKRASKRKMEDSPSTSETFPVELSEEEPMHTDLSHSPEDLHVQPEPNCEKPDKYIDHNYCSKYATSCPGCSERQSVIDELKKKNRELRKNVKISRAHSENFVTSIVMKNDKSVSRFTGISSKKKLSCIHNFVAPKVGKMRYWTGKKKESSSRSRPTRKSTPQKPGPTRTLTSLQELILVLMKLRLALTISFLASLFQVSASTASQVFNTWVKFLAEELKPLVFWPEAVRPKIPKSLMGKYKNLRCTIDCTEIFIEKPRNLHIQALTWSEYKRHNTVKFLVAIAPNGHISFLSDAWGGRATDVHITRESGFLNLIDPGDLILADRGFIIREDLIQRQATLEIPPPSKGIEQQKPEDVAKTKKIANARIHVERAIGRLKWFSILQETLPISLIPLIDDIITVCAALVNLQGDLVK